MNQNALAILLNTISTTDGKGIPAFKAQLSYLSRSNYNQFDFCDIILTDLSQNFFHPGKSYFVSIYTVTVSGKCDVAHINAPDKWENISKWVEKYLTDFPETIECFSIAISKTKKIENYLHYVFVYK